MSSSRLPGKVLMKSAGQPLLTIMIKRIKCAKNINNIVVITSHDSSDEPIVQWCKTHHIKYFRGELHDVQKRYLGAS